MTTQDLTLATDPREESAYDALLPAARALDSKEVQQVNLEPSAVVTASLAVAETMKEHRAFLTSLPSFDIASLDGLEPAALALAVAHSDYKAAVTPPDSLATLVERGGQIRDTFEAWTPGLANAHLIDASRVEGLHTGNGYRELAVGLTTYVRVCRGSNWVEIKAKSALTDALLDEAESVAQRIFAVVGRRELSPARIAAAADIRQRMFTICTRRYDQVRRAVTFMRWTEGDADTLVPSLYAKGPRSAPVAKPAETPVAPAAHATPAAASSATPAAPVVASAGSHEVGVPGQNPFIQ